MVHDGTPRFGKGDYQSYSPASLMCYTDRHTVLMTDQEVGVAQSNNRVQALLDRQLQDNKLKQPPSSA